MRTLSTIIATAATAAALTAAAPAAFAAPNTGSGGSSDSGSGSSGSGGCGPRTSADRQYLRESHQDDKSCAKQDTVIQLAQAQCRYLDANGNTARNHITLAERSRGTVQYPYISLDAAIDAYCPRHSD
ncbi:DUF732 domain-containing protein [Nocardia sp. NPDC057668]|uniref:DUF732 domain-containing protein n=1 Tax=Nocardia sp. NPDC057668 TaxID=3346202 RepID=UPI00366AA9EE